MSTLDSGPQDPLLSINIDYPPPKFHEAVVSDHQQLEDHYAFDRPISPFASGQIDGLESLHTNPYFHGRAESPGKVALEKIGLFDPPLQYAPSPADLALSAMQYLPYPLMVLDGTKTLVMANDAMGRLLGIEDHDDDGTNSDDGVSPMDRLKGQTLSQMGIDLLQDGRPVWVAWESFLDSIAEEGTPKDEDADELESGEVTPTVEMSRPSARQTSPNKSTIQDAVVEVILVPGNIAATVFASGINKNGYVAIGSHFTVHWT
jgi:hypothetical protein